jgi:regulator of sigma D
MKTLILLMEKGKPAFGALKVPEINRPYGRMEKKLKPILKFDDWGNEVCETENTNNIKNTLKASVMTALTFLCMVLDLSPYFG